MTPEDLVRTLGRFGIEPDMVAIEKRANAAFERLDTLLEQGVAPDEATWKAVERQFQNDVKRSLRTMTKAAIGKYQEARGAEVSRYATWVTVGDNDVCPSCEPRHGQTNTWKAWAVLGKPRSAALVCSQECRCQLVPELHAPASKQAA